MSAPGEHDKVGRFDGRAAAFWIGAFITIPTSAVLYVIVSINDGGTPNWLAAVTLLGTVLAYWIAWVGSNHRSLRVLAVLVYAGAMAPAIMSPVQLIYIIGLLGLVTGKAGDRSAKTVNPRQSP